MSKQPPVQAFGGNLGEEENSSSGASVERLQWVVATLRQNCRWTAALTHESLLKYLLEESYELVDVIESPEELDYRELQGELGDVLYQVMLHSVLASEKKAFDLADVADGLSRKLMRRNAHIFSDDGTLRTQFPESIAEIEQIYEARKAKEKLADNAKMPGPFDSIAKGLPALALAQKSLDRAQGRGQENSRTKRSDRDTGRSTGHGSGQRDENPAPSASAPSALGAELFELVRRARSAGLDAEQLLREETLKFQRDFLTKESSIGS